MLGDGDHQAQVGLDQATLGLHVVALDAHGQGHLFGGGQQRYLADRLEIEAHRVAGGRLHREVELGGDLLLGCDLVLPTGASLIGLDDLDAEVVQGEEDGLELLGRQVELCQHVVEVVGEQVALLASLPEQLLDLFDRKLSWIAERSVFGRAACLCACWTVGRSE